MDKIYAKIENYLKQQFPKKKIILNSSMRTKNCELYGFNRFQILVNESDKFVEYKLKTVNN